MDTEFTGTELMGSTLKDSASIKRAQAAATKS
jgi:hypothetical protein